MALLNQTPQAYYNGNDFGGYQFVSLSDIINQFMLIYVGEDKIISKAKRLDVAFHAQRALAELSFDTLKSFKSQEIDLPPSLQMKLPQDYVNYTNIFWVDSAGVKHPIYPTKHTQNPVEAPLQDSDGEFKLEAEGTTVANSDALTLTNRVENILVGMVVTGVNIPDNTTIKDIVYHEIYTAITLTNNATAAATEILQFSNPDGSLLTPKNAIHIINESSPSLDWTIGENTMTAITASDISSLEVGMLVYHEDFPVGTKIANITSTTILLDQEATATMGANAGQVVFVDPNKDTKTWSKYKSSNPSENEQYNYDYDDEVLNANLGGRYGLDPAHAQVNGSFYIDDVRGLIHFSSNLSGQCIVLDYISDSLGTEEEMQVHKFAEEAMYKCIAFAVASGRVNIPEYTIQRLKKEKFASVRTAKLRLSNLKIEQLTQVLRGKSKWIKH